MNSDVRIKGGTIQTPEGGLRADVLISDGRVAALVDPDAVIDAKQEMDASDRWVLPGLVDLHCHARVPGYEYKEDFLTASRAAAVGGITTMVDMPNVDPPTTTVDLLEKKREIAAKQSVIDWGHFVGGATEVEEIEALAAAGATGFKIFQVSGGYPHDPRLAENDTGTLLAIFEAIAATKLPCLVHPFDQSVFEKLSEQALAAGLAETIDTFAEIYTKDIVWRSAVAVLLELARETNVRLQVVHTHSHGSLRLLRHAKAEGVGVVVAIDPKYFHLRASDMEEQGARAIPGGYVTDDAERMDAIWQALDDGTIDIIDSDHAPHTLDDLELMDQDPWVGPFGSPHYDHLLPLLLTDVHQGRLRIERLVELVSANPAKVLGRYPEKGSLQPGASADLVIVDPTKTVHPSDDQMESKSAWTPYVDFQLVGAPVLTMLRGEVIAKDGVVIGEPGFGEYISGRPLELVTPPPGLSPGLSLARPS